MSKINVRSPYFINISANGLASVELKLHIYSGTKTTSRPATATYTLSADAILSGTGLNTSSFEIAELVRDYISNTFNDTYSSSNLWVDYTTQETNLAGSTGSVSSFTQLTAFDGYGYFEDAANPQNDLVTLQSNELIFTNDFSAIRIPVYVSSATSVTYLKDKEQIFRKDLATSTSSTLQIQYVENSALDADAFKNRVDAIADTTVEAFNCVKAIANEVYQEFDADAIYIEQSGVVDVIKIQEIEECKHTPYKVTFINKFGALQDLWFFKRANLSLSTKNEEYTANTVSNGSYSINQASKTIFNKRGTEMLKLNTGFYPESYNEIFRQLSLSEEVWIKYEGQTLPIIVKTSSLNYKTSINDKLINYTMDVEFAFNKINNIR
jgi:hypothetical protein